MFCPTCGSEQSNDHRFCAYCGGRLPVELFARSGRKQTNLFLGIPTHRDDAPEPVLRVSRYVDEVEVDSVDGSVVIPGHHVRISIWLVDRPVCAMSLSEKEAERLGQFLIGSVRVEPASRTSTPV
jgi:hypothetical protein